MQRLAFMAGKWQGEGWMESGGERHAFRGGEVVQEKLGGLALLIEGTFYDLDNPDRRDAGALDPRRHLLRSLRRRTIAS